MMHQPEDETMNDPSTDSASAVAGESAADRAERMRNNVKKLREQRLLSKAELARKSGLSALTIDRVEAGMPCRMDTKRKIILALGMTIEEKDKVFVPNEEEGSEDGQG
jgi:DNA-binding XRE family transcriptional regulator